MTTAKSLGIKTRKKYKKWFDGMLAPPPGGRESAFKRATIEQGLPGSGSAWKR